jgi:FixJ family two-component response regulator
MAGELKQVPMISIIDDDESSRESTKSLVRSLGYNAVTFGSAEEFLESTQVTATSCLITDVQMPGLNGVELQDRLIADGHRMPVIFVTGFPDEELQKRALKRGAIGYLRKPCSEDHLITHIDAALASHKSSAARR